MVDARRGPPIHVGALDSGVDPRHPALRGRVAGFLYVDEEGVPRPERAAFDDDGHGTHTAGLVCGGSVRGRPAIGRCPGARLFVAAVIEQGMVPVRMLVGLHWLARQPIRVLHLPLGIVGRTPLLHEAISRLRRRGVLVVAAAGNGGSGRVESPACYPQVLTVGACDERGEPAAFSASVYAEDGRRCIKPDVLAPGVALRSAAPGRGMVRLSGTSMASACVAGLAASLFAAVPGATPSQVEAAIVRSARPLPAELAHRSRHGVVDFAGARAWLRRGRDLRRPPRPPIRWDEGPRCDAMLERRLRLRIAGDELDAIVMLRPGFPGGALAGLVERHARAARVRG
ncbi:MAG: S8 family serine peptidase, partial [Myxococcales bacterium]|nr:S8 family serine peptidase [Myxococcales bacterium]